MKERVHLSQNDYFNDRLNAQRLLSFSSLLIPLGLFCIFLIAPHASDWKSDYIQISISCVIILFSAIRLIRSWNTPRGNKYQVYCAFLDFLSIAAILIGYSISYDVPLSSTLKSPTANILYIHLSSRIVLFNGNIIFQTGLIAIVTWVSLTLLSLYEPNSLGRTSGYVEYLTGFKILIGAEIERIVQLAIISTILYGYIYFARHDSPTGFLRRAYFLQSLMKFFGENRKKFKNRHYALIEIKAASSTHTEHEYAPIFKSLSQSRVFENLPFKKFGRLSSSRFLAWVEFKGDNKALNQSINQLHKELTVLATEKLGSRMPNFIIGATLLDLKSNEKSQIAQPSIAIKEALATSRKTIVFDSILEAKLQAKHSIEQAIKQGLEDKLFYVVYQPIIDLMTERPVGLEALIRLKMKAEDPIGPDAFIPIAEDSGLIDEITEYLCETIARDSVEIAHMFSGSGIEPYVNINISPIQLKDMARITSALQRASSNGLKINAEITESTVLNDGNADDQIRSLITAGFDVAIDDFGTGYSSIERLMNLNHMVLKIDQSFVKDIENAEAYSFLAAIVNIAQCTSSSVIIEGVENLQQQLLIMKLGVRYCQGFFFAKPMGVGALRAYLADKYDFVPTLQRRAGRIAPF